MDCACGTGDMSIFLQKKGFNVDAFDISEEMLMIAKEKTHNLGLHVNYTVQDMTHFLFHKTFSFITCINDGLNYLTQLIDVEKFFNNCRMYLQDKGFLLFDISTSYKLEKMDGQLFAEEDDDFAYIWFNEYDKTEKLLNMDLSFYTKVKDGLFARTSETHVQRGHSIEEIKSLLEKCGLNLTALYADISPKKPASTSERIHFLAQKN